jgi:predicted nucleic acid-binding protein
VSHTVFLDTGVLGLVTNPQRSVEGAACLQWVQRLLDAEDRVVVPEIADYELRRELIRAKRARGLARLDAVARWLDYLPLTTEAMRVAARCWAEARQQGRPGADNRNIDSDMILAGQAMVVGRTTPNLVIATTNIRHFAQFVPAERWQNIEPTRMS